jgi:predicted ester cyclase
MISILHNKICSRLKMSFFSFTLLMITIGVVPGWHATIDDAIAEGDKVVHRITGRGTHKGEWMGIAPTGKQVTVTANIIYRIASDKIVEEWFEYDVMALMQQLGAVPPPGQGGS